MDISQIAGFESMTLEQLQDWIKAYEPPKPVISADELGRLKVAFNKASSDLANEKRRVQELEQGSGGASTTLADLQAKYDALLRKDTIAETAAKYRKMGYDEELALGTATAFVDNDEETLFANFQKHQSDLEGRIRAEIAAGAPKPDGRGAGTGGEEGADVSLAKKLAAARAATAKNTSDILKGYIK